MSAADLAHDDGDDDDDDDDDGDDDDDDDDDDVSMWGWVILNTLVKN